MSEIVWVMGISAAGKETFIRDALTDTDLQKILGWSEKTITFSKTSVHAIAHFDGDRVTENRSKISTESIELAKSTDVVLIKWQYLDSDTGRISKLRNEIPTADHSAIVLTAETETLAARLRTKTWWEDCGREREPIKQEQQRLDKCLEQLELPIITLSNESDYKILQQS